MEGRTRLAAGGFIAGSASIAAVAAVIMTNSAALADVSGAPVHASSIVLPMAASAAPTAVPTAPAVSTAPPIVAEQPLVVEEAPEVEETPAAPSTVTTVATAPSAATEESIVAAAAATGTWDAAYEWSKNHGWTSGQTSEWLVRLEAKLHTYAQSRETRAPETSGLDRPGLMSGSQKDRSPDSPDHSD
ncbi:hypothetical protein [Microbacterium sp. RU33B]|uniref:hypothetical protein n=1 Tax=Microbacterium sp. RU33B TaxID=1907390 RepID=UPI00095D79CF|nr:hypothetical protein [Microbacterium sp. RU33B]SIT71354.1 hypothetical protein SAMN05880545_0845 [Microbacterium sp. RU33B]